MLQRKEPSLIWSQKFIRWWKSCCTVHTLQTTPQVATNNRTKSRGEKEKRQLARWKPNQYRHRYMQWCHMHGNSPSSCLATRPSSAQSSPAHLLQMIFFFSSDKFCIAVNRISQPTTAPSFECDTFFFASFLVSSLSPLLLSLIVGFHISFFFLNPPPPLFFPLFSRRRALHAAPTQFAHLPVRPQPARI